MTAQCACHCHDCRAGDPCSYEERRQPETLWARQLTGKSDEEKQREEDLKLLYDQVSP